MEYNLLHLFVAQGSRFKIQYLLKYQLAAKMTELHGILQYKDKYTDLEQHQK